MFERTRIDNRHADAEKTAHSVELTLEGGETLTGRLHMPVTRTLGDELNAGGGFLEFEAFSGERSFLAKSAVVRVRSNIAPRADQLVRNQRQVEGFDPHAVLKVPQGADRETIRAAYHRMAKAYHPDRFAGLELPAEVAEYLSAVARRVNAAYSLLQSGSRAEPAVARPGTASPTASAPV